MATLLHQALEMADSPLPSESTDGAANSNSDNSPNSDTTSDRSKLEMEFINLARTQPINYFTTHETSIRGAISSVQMLVQAYLLTINTLITTLCGSLTNSPMVRDLASNGIRKFLWFRRWVTYLTSQQVWTLSTTSVKPNLPDSMVQSMKNLYLEELTKLNQDMATAA